jgi:hypothetical protein
MIEDFVYQELLNEPHLIMQLALGEFQHIMLATAVFFVYILERTRHHVIVQLTDNEHVVRFRVQSPQGKF